MLSKYKYFSKIVILLCILSIFGVGFSSDIIKTNITKLHEKKVLESLNAILLTTQESLNNWGEELINISQFVSKDDQVQDLVESITKNGTEKDQKKLNKILRQLTNTHKFIETSIISKSMKYIANSTIQKVGSRSLLNKNSSILLKLNQGKSVITPPEKSVDFFFNQDGKKEKNIPKICIISPIVIDQEVLAYLVLNVNPMDKFLKIFQSGRLGKTGETYAIRADGIMASETRFLSQLREVDSSITTSVLRQKIKDPSTRELTHMASSVIQKKSSFNIEGYNDYRGVSVVGAWTWNESFKIGITSEQDYSEAFSELSLSYALIDKFSIALVIAFLLLSLTFLFNSKLARKNQNILLKFNEDLKKQVDLGVKEAEDANKAKSRFFSQMSHEIRTPMNAIIGYSELLEQSHLTEDQMENLSQISESGKFLLQLINEILDFSKIESGELILEESPFNLKNTAESIIDLLRYKTSVLNVLLKLEIDPELSDFFVGDSHRIKQIIMNLTSNALKFTQQGEVIVSLKKSNSDLNIEWVEISVTDTGIGIPTSEIDRIFNDFTQADSSTTRLYGGTGLGLTISKKIVEVMGGEIGVTSTLGQGSTFWFKLPLIITSNVVTSEVSLNYDKDKIKDLKVLIAEDNGVNRRLAIKLLKLVGFSNIKTVADGQEAIDFVQNNEVDIIFMDVMMPKLDGMDATRKIRELGYSPEDLKIIALTANAFSEDRAQCIKAGMNEHIKKPFKRADVIACLKQLHIC
jgi:signal transduction histidine kinase/ActR/RegA family two-component response regulator